MSYAVIKTGGKQYKVKSGEIIKIEKLPDSKPDTKIEFKDILAYGDNKMIEVGVLRNQKEMIFSTYPKTIDSKDSFGNSIKKRVIGIKIAPVNNEFKREKLGPTKAMYYSIKEIWFVSKTTLNYVRSLIMGQADTSQLGGPIKIAKISGQVAEFGLLAFISTIAYISISLGLINLFPIPLLDGGHLMFYLFEKILGRPLKQATQEGFFRIGLFLLLSLMVFTTFNDLKDWGLF